MKCVSIQAGMGEWIPRSLERRPSKFGQIAHDRESLKALLPEQTQTRRSAICQISDGPSG